MNMWIKKWNSRSICSSALGRQDLPPPPPPPDNRIVINESVVLAPDQQLITLGTSTVKSCEKCAVEEEEEEEESGIISRSDRHRDHAVLITATDQEKEAAADDDDGHHHHHVVLKSDKPNSSFLHCVLNMSGMLIGLGQLSTPYALETAGWASCFLLIGLGVACAYTAHLLGKCLDKDPTSRSYADIGSQAFGKSGKILACTFIYMEIFMALVSYTISLHDNINTVFTTNTTSSTAATFSIPALHLSSDKLITTVAVLVALPSLWIRDLSLISFLSTGGILMSLLIFVTVVSTAVFGHVEAGHYALPVLKVRNIPQVTGLYVFSFAGHIVFPNIHRAMKDPTQFKKVAIVSFTLVTLLYTAIAFTGAKLFGPTVSSQVTLSMPRHLVATKIALWATVLTPMTKYALEFTPFATQLEQRLPASGRARTVVRGTVGSVLLLAILALALSVPYFQYVLGLTGSLVSIGICVVMPCVFYLRVFKGEVTWVGVGVNVGLIVVGCLLGVFGTVSSSRLLVKSLMEGGNTRG